MGQPVLDLLNANNWTQIYDESRKVVLLEPGWYSPIPDFEIPIQLDKQHIFAARCLSTTAKSTWRWAGNLIQKITPALAGVSSPLIEVSSYSMKLNRIHLVIFKPYIPFRLTLESAYWLQDLRLTLWKYQGIDSDSTDVGISTIERNLSRIELKIDDISAYN